MHAAELTSLYVSQVSLIQFCSADRWHAEGDSGVLAVITSEMHLGSK